MIIISFSPAMTGDQCMISQPMVCLAPRRRIEAKTLAECEAAWRDACAFARTIPAADILAHWQDRKNDGTEPRVSVSLSWVTRDRKPSGFNKRNWHAYVAPVAMPQAAE